MKKAQIQMGETIAVLFIFFIMIAFGLIFYARIQTGSFEKQKEENAMLKAIEVTQRATFLPELVCSSDNVPIHNCIDAQKLNAFHYIIGTNDRYKIHYYDLLSFSNITVTQIYPPPPLTSGHKKIYLNEKNWTKKVNTKIPVTIYDSTQPLDSQFSFGVINVDVYI